MRFHLFEWEDQDWLPSLFRDFITEHLAAVSSRAFPAVVPKLVEHIASCGGETVIDLCSGAGGPLPGLHESLSRELGKPVDIVLTDWFPNLRAFSLASARTAGSIRFHEAPVDARNCPPELRGPRTLFNAFHHFKPDDARKILEDAARKAVPIAIFEIQERSWFGIVVRPLIAPIASLLLTPFVGRLSIARAFFTYVLPIAPLLLSWDAAVSGLRAYTLAELKAMTNDLTSGGYAWEAGRIVPGGRHGPVGITYLVGRPGMTPKDAPAPTAYSAA